MELLVAGDDVLALMLCFLAFLTLLCFLWLLRQQEKGLEKLY